jgi:hypothetical protein
MKKGHNRVFTVILTAALTLTVLPPLAFAEGDLQGGSLAQDSVAQSEPTLERDSAFGLLPEPSSPVPSTDSAEAVTEDVATSEAGSLSTLADGILIDATNFPDAIFRAYVEDNFDTDDDGTLSGAEAAAVTSIHVSRGGIVTSGSDLEREPGIRVSGQGVISLEGIEHFPALEELSCSNNQLTSLDVSQNPALRILQCSNNQLTSLDVSGAAALMSLECGYNRLVSLDVSGAAALMSLQCSNNQLTSLDVTQNAALVGLVCSDNQLASLDVAHKPALVDLQCFNNQLTSLDVSHNSKLGWLWCFNNQLTSLDVAYNPALGDLRCDNNQLTSLDVSHNSKLGDLRCDNNQLTSLDVAYNPALGGLRCDNNQLTSLDVSHNSKLGWLSCSGNQLLDVIGLPDGLWYLEASSQTATIPVIPDPLNPGSYLSNAAYSLGTRTITLDGTAAGFDAAAGRFSTTSLDAPIGFETDDGTGKKMSGTVTFKASASVPVILAPGTWTGSGDAVAKIDAPYEDFVWLMLNGKEVDPTNYTVSAGSTVITFHKSYLDTLANGEYTFTAVFTNSTADIPVKVSTRASGGGAGTLPATGDAASLGLMALVALLAAAGVCLVTRRGQLQRRSICRSGARRER